MANREVTYRFVQVALSIGDPDAMDVAMLAGTFANPSGVTVGAVRERLRKSKAIWRGALRRILWGLDDDETIGRFRVFQSAWNTWMKPKGPQWAKGAARIALARTPASAVAEATKLKKLAGAGPYQLGQIMHLLHPSWFAIVNHESGPYWKALGYKVGGVANLEAISTIYRKRIRDAGLDFNAIDDCMAKPYVASKKIKKKTK